MSDTPPSTPEQPENQPENLSVEEFTKVESIFVRHRNVLLVRAQFTPIYTDYYLHLMEQKLRHKEELDQKLKDLMAVLTLHLVARPWAETIAWTINLRAPRVNLFATGSSLFENITGHLFTENVKEPDRNVLYSQTLIKNTEGRKSHIELETEDPLQWVETYYMQSEQRPARVFRLDDENFALLAAQPDADTEWLESLTAEDVAKITETEQTKVLETRKFRFHCGCSPEKIIPALRSWKDRKDELFQGDPFVEATCPRCGAKHLITPDML